MSCLTEVYKEFEGGEKLCLKRRQLPINVDDNKIMIMQLSDTCEGCALVNCENRGKKKVKPYSEEALTKHYNILSKEEALLALVVPSRTLFNRLAQVVGCVGCRRSVERMFNQLKESSNPAIEPLIVNSSGVLSILKEYSTQPKKLSALFAEHSAPLNEMLDNIPKLKKSGRCVLHSMEGVRCRPGSHSWLEVWDSMSATCRDSSTIINCEQLLVTLDNYLRKHRFCHDCKNKVHRAYEILVCGTSPEAVKEKGYVASLYAGIKNCGKKHIHVAPETDYIMHLITRAEPELLGRRERHAKTLEIAQEEVLTCLGLFLYERFQRIQAKLKEEEQTWYILFHMGLDALRRNIELKVEEKQGFSKFEMLCEELQKQELLEKAKKDKKKRKKNKRKSEETKENYISEEDEEPNCHECETNRISPLQINSTISPKNRNVTHQKVADVCTDNLGGGSNLKWRGGGKTPPERKSNSLKSDDRRVRARSETKERENSSLEPFYDRNTNHQREQCQQPSKFNERRSPSNLEGSESIDSLTSRCSQCSKDGCYCSAQCSASSSRESSDVACGEGFCSHSDDLETLETSRETCNNQEEPSREINKSSPPGAFSFPFASSLQKMLDDSSCEADEIPEAEVQAWHARLGSVKQKRAELRQTLRQRFQQLCHKTTLHTGFPNNTEET